MNEWKKYNEPGVNLNDLWNLAELQWSILSYKLSLSGLKSLDRTALSNKAGLQSGTSHEGAETWSAAKKHEAFSMAILLSHDLIRSTKSSVIIGWQHMMQ